MDETIRHAWQEFHSERLDANSTRQCGYLNTIIKAQAQIVRILGLNSCQIREENDPIEELACAMEKMSSVSVGSSLTDL